MPAYVRLALIGISLYASAGKVLLLGRPSHVNGTRGIMHVGDASRASQPPYDRN